MPAVDNVLVVGGVGTGHHIHLLPKIAHPWVVAARHKVVFRHGDDAVPDAHGHRPRVGHVFAPGIAGRRIVVHQIHNHIGIFGVRTNVHVFRLAFIKIAE